MKKKSLIVLFTLFAFLLINTVSFANDIKNDVNNATNMVIDGVTSASEKAREGVGAVENTVENVVSGAGNLVRNIGNDMSNNNDNNNTNNDQQNNYTASRVSTENTPMNIIGNATPWVIIATAFAIIIGLTWYYLTQRTNYND